MQNQEEEESEQGSSVLAVRESKPKLWNPPSEFKFPCPEAGHDHEIRKCKEFFNMNPKDRWEKLEKGRICFSCLQPRGTCKLRVCANHSKVPKDLKCAQCALWGEPKNLAPFRIFFCKRKEHGESRA